MKAKLTFNLPEDNHEYRVTVISNDMEVALFKINRYIKLLSDGERDQVPTIEVIDKLRECTDGIDWGLIME